MSYPIIYRTLGSGTYIIDEAGQNLGAHKLVYRGPADTWLLADADAVASMPVIGLTLAAIGAGLNGRIMFTGYVGDAAWTWTTGGEAGKIYASTTPGELSQTAPVGAGDVVQVVAVAFFSTGIWFDPAGLGGGGGVSELSPETAVVGFNAALAPLVNYFLADTVADEVTINAAIAYVGALGGGSVFLERGTYTLADSVAMNQNQVKLVGQGWDTFLNQGGITNGISITGTQCLVRDLAVSTPAGGGNAADGINISAAAIEARIQNVYVNQCDQHGITIGGARTVVTDCYIFDADNIGIRTLGVGDDTIIANNVINTTGDDGIFINADSENCVVEGNRITNWTGQPVDDDSASSIVRDNNAGGDVVNSNGCGFATIQLAIDDLVNGGEVIVPARTFTEAVLMNNADTVLRGLGWDSVIDGGTTGHAINVSGQRCIIKDLQVSTTQGGTNNYDGVFSNQSDLRILNIFVNGSDRHGFNLQNVRNIVQGCRVFNIDEIGIQLTAVADNSVISDNIIDTTGGDGITINAAAENCIVSNNRITGWTGEPIDDDSDTSVVTNNNCGGDVMNSKGCAFGTVQASIDHLAGDGWVEVPDGTWAEAVTITDSDVMLRGRSWASIIDGGTTGHAIDVSGSNCIIRDLTVLTTAGEGTAFNGIEIASPSWCRVINVHVDQSDNVGININGARGKVENCRVETCDAQGILGSQFGDDSIIIANQLAGNTGNDIEITANCENCIVTSNRAVAGAIVDNSGTSTVANNDVT